MTTRRKLIEVSLPLEEINAQSARENYIYKGNPSSVHKWWAQRPLATARAVLFSQLVDDPSNNVNAYRQEAAEKGYENPAAWVERRVKHERQRLFDLITRMVNWDNLGDEALFDAVRAEILKSTNGNPPPILDPFAGGGTIPLEAQRLGLEAHASDLNPVAVLINKALTEIPPKFAGRPPVFPGASEQRNSWPRATGLAEDVRRYGVWMCDEAERRIGHLYPKAVHPDGSKATVIAWIWARTVACPNPACGIEMPLVRSWWLSKKKGKEAYVVPKVVGRRIEYTIGRDPRQAPASDKSGTMAGRKGAVCVSCASAVTIDFIKGEGLAGRMGAALLGIVGEGHRERTYFNPAPSDVETANVPKPANTPEQRLADDPRNLWTPPYGLASFDSLFTNRQLVALTTFSDLVAEVAKTVERDARSAWGEKAFDPGSGSPAAYGRAVATLLAFAIDKHANYGNSLATWYPQESRPAHLFSRQAIPMAWDYPEVNPFSEVGGAMPASVRIVADSLEGLGGGSPARVAQADAASRDYAGLVVSTDPPYYDNITYSDLSDFFYVWLRRSLQTMYPELLGTMVAPKADELVANPYRHGGAEGARRFFEDGFRDVFQKARDSANWEYPITVYYAFKQSESDERGRVSTGWETILDSMVKAGWTVTATWPVRSERTGRMIGIGTNALASSVVLALRPRPEGAPITDRRGFIATLKRELGPALRELQQGGIAPVDLPQSAIGPGMAVFSRYAKVIESDGSEMSVRSALARINEMLDELLAEQEGDFDAPTRFALVWYRQHGYESAPYGEAEDLARARGTAVSTMERGGILSARAGRVQLYRPADLPDDYDVLSDPSTSAWETLHHAIRILGVKGITAAGQFLWAATQRAEGAVDLDLVKELAYLLFQISEKNGWAKDALSFNAIASSWSDVLDAGREAKPAVESISVTLDLDELE